jgi:outer membrane usher protein
VHLDTGDDFLVGMDDLNSMGLKVPPGKTSAIDGQLYQSLRSVSDITYIFDKKTLTLNITSSPSLLSRSVIDLYPRTNLTVYYPRETSVFLNYGLNYFHSDIMDARSFSLANKLGVHSGDLLFLTDTIYTQTPDDSRFVRLMSSVTYERRSDLQWFIFGDTFASSGDLGSTINVGGVSIVKTYRLDPYFIRQPTFGVSGAATLPSEASIYLDGMLMRRERISPGGFDLKNLDYYGGSHMVEIVLKDPFGNEQRIVEPFYFTNAVLKQGLHEYNYTVGRLRQQYGLESNEYGDTAFSAFHLYGVSDALTLGGRAEATRGVTNIGPLASFLIPRAGVAALSLAASRNQDDKPGLAGSFSHSFQHLNFSTRLQYRKYSENYVNIQSISTAVRPKSDFGVGVSYTLGRSNTISIDYLSARTYDGIGRDALSGTYSAAFTNNLSGFLTASRIEDKVTGAAFEVFFGINYTLGKNTYLSSMNRQSEGMRDNIVQVYHNITSGEGLSYRASYESIDSDVLHASLFSPYVQYNARYGIYSADYSYQQSNGQDYSTYSLSAAGAAVYAGGIVGFTRPINDSFSIVKVDGLKDVAVSVANIEMGRTDSSGMLVIPEMRSYNYNQVSVDPGNISMQYQLSAVNAYISPSQWSGTCFFVTARKLQAYTGRVVVVRDGSTDTVKMSELAMTVKGRELRFPSGMDGEFYFENTIPGPGKVQKPAFQGCQALSDRGAETETVITPGRYDISFDYQGRKCTAILEIKISDDIIVDLGNVIGQCGEMPARSPEVEKVLQPAPPVLTSAIIETPKSITLHPGSGKSGMSITSVEKKDVTLLIRFLREHPDYQVIIEGHSDRHGSEEDGLRLGRNMAENMKKYLVHAGLDMNRIMRIETLGKKQPLCNQPNAACDKINRRVVVRVVTESGK